MFFSRLGPGYDFGGQRSQGPSDLLITSHQGAPFIPRSLLRPHLQDGCYISTASTAEYLHKLIGILRRGRSVSVFPLACDFSSVSPGVGYGSLLEGVASSFLVSTILRKASPESLRNRLSLTLEEAELWPRVRRAGFQLWSCHCPRTSWSVTSLSGCVLTTTGVCEAAQCFSGFKHDFILLPISWVRNSRRVTRGVLAWNLSRGCGQTLIEAAGIWRYSWVGHPRWLPRKLGWLPAAQLGCSQRVYMGSDRHGGLPPHRVGSGVISQTGRWDGTVARGAHCGATPPGSKVGSIIRLEV